jgi:hypothetical protein
MGGGGPRSCEPGPEVGSLTQDPEQGTGGGSRDRLSISSVCFHRTESSSSIDVSAASTFVAVWPHLLHGTFVVPIRSDVLP